MAVGGSRWRVSDAEAHDRLIGVANEVLSGLIEVRRSAGADAPGATEAILEIRRSVWSVDGFDRVAVDTLTEQLTERRSQRDEVTP